MWVKHILLVHAMFVGKAYLAGSWGRKLWVTNKLLFMKINEGINTCSWGCKFVGKDGQKNPRTLVPHEQ